MRTRYGLTLGAVDFCDPAGGIEVIRDGQSSWGSPQTVTAVVDSLLADGSLVKVLRDDNRTVTFTVAVHGTDSGAMAWREKALVDELYRANVLTYTPPDGGPSSVFEVQEDSECNLAFDLDREEAGIRLYTVSLTCAPYVSSASSSTVSSAAVGAGTATVLSSGSSTTGWTGKSTVQTAAGHLSVLNAAGTYAPPPAGGGDYGLTTWTTWASFAPSSAINFSAAPQVYIDVVNSESYTYGGTLFFCAGPTPSLRVDGGSPIAPFARYNSPDVAGYTRFVFRFDGTASASLRFDFTGTLKSNDPTATGHPTGTDFANLGYAGLAPGLKANETLFTTPIRGARRAPASLHLYRAGAGSIGDAIIYTGPDLADGYNPSMRRYAVGGTSDGSAWSGFNGWTTPPAVPVGVLSPGAYVAVARVKAGTAKAQAKLTWTASLGGRTQTSTVYAPLTTAYGLVVLGGLVLPPIAVPGMNTQTVTVSVADDLASATIDDLYLLRLGDGSSITILKGAKAHVWSNAPTFDNPQPGLFTGAAADGSDALSAQNLAGGWDVHLALPGDLLTWVVCTATDARLDITYTKQWHTHAAE